MTDPAFNIDAFREARMWADLHGHAQPDDRMLTAYGRALIDQLRTATADTVRRMAEHQHACAAGTPIEQPATRLMHASAAEALDEAVRAIESALRTSREVTW